MRFLYFLIFVSSFSFSQTKLPTIREIQSCQNTPQIVDSGLNTLTTNFHCGEQIKFGTVRIQDVFPWSNPAFNIGEINANFFPSPSRSIRVYKNGVLWHDIPYTQTNQPIPNTGGYLDPTAIYTYEICDTTTGGSFPYTVIDLTDETVIASGSFDIPAGGGCASVTFGPIGGTYTFSGDGITDLGNGTCIFNSSDAGIGTHTITYSFTNARGCSGTASVQITVNGPSVDSGDDIAVCKGEQVIIGNTSSVTGGTGGIIYNWSSSISGNVSNNQSFNITADTSETYYLSITDVDGLGCTVTDSLTITTYELPKVELLPDNFENCAGDSTLITANYLNGSGTINYVALSGDTALLSNFGTNNAVFSTTQPGSYSIGIFVSDDNSCTATANVNITVNQNPNIIIDDIANVKCYNDSNAYVNFSSSLGASPFIYFLNSDSNLTGEFNNLQADTYFVKIIDNNLCETDTQITITQPDSLSINYYTSPEICENSNGSITINASGGTAGYSYNWDNISQDTNYVHGLNAGVYNLTIVDNNLCEKQVAITVGGSGGISINLDSVHNVTCNGFNNANIFAKMFSNTEYYISYLYKNNILIDSVITVDSIINFSNLNQGNYSIVVVDSNNCTDTLNNVNITEPLPLELVYSEIKDVSCFGAADGSINIEINGGTFPYKFYWNNVLGNEDVDFASAGTYILRTNDNNNCIRTDTFFVNQPTKIDVADTIIIKNNLGNIILDVNGGTPEYYYNWSNGEISSNNNNLISGEYFVTITDKNNCSVEKKYIIELPLFIPNVITPNADGKNDTWKIQNIESYGNIEITILNRWGDVLFKYKGNAYDNEENQWNGTYNGKELPLGTYMYLLKLSDNEVKSGTITIIR